MIFFAGFEESRRLFDALCATIGKAGEVEFRISKSQIAFYRNSAYAWAWIPGKYLKKNFAPLVFSLSLRRRDPSPRWKEIVEPAIGRFMHHLELYSIEEIDDEVLNWHMEARELAGIPHFSGKQQIDQ